MIGSKQKDYVLMEHAQNAEAGIKMKISFHSAGCVQCSCALMKFFCVCVGASKRVFVSAMS